MNMVKHKYRLDESKLTLNDISKLDSIALHHTDSDNNIVSVTDWHMNGNKWSWIGYGYWIDKKGNVYECRGYKYQNAAVADNNGHIVSIAFQGNYNVSYPMPVEQFNAGVELIKYIKSQLPNINTIDGHKKWNQTDCPGKYFPLQNMISKVNEVKVDAEFDNALQMLKDNLVINSFDYWKNHQDKYVRQLIINMANTLMVIKTPPI